MRIMALFNRYSENWKLDHIPGEYGLPIIGNSLKLVKDARGFSNYMADKYGPVHKSSAFMRRTVMMLGPEANEFVLMDRDRNFSSTRGWNPILEAFFPNGLMLRDFDNHKAHRKIMQTAFKAPVLKGYIHHLNKGISERLETWGQTPDFDFYPAIKQLTLDLAASVFLGVPLGPEADKLNRSFVDSVQAAVAIIRAPIPGTKFWRGVRGRKYIQNYLREQIPQRRDGKGEDMFTLLCQAADDEGNRFTDDEIVDHLNFLMMAAHDTLTSSLTTMIYHLGRNREWQENLRNECRSLGLGPDELSYDNLADLQMVEWAFKEALRINPPVPMIPRLAVRDIEFGGFKIPAGTAVGVSPGYTHKMPELWENPEAFEPDRFSEQRGEDRRHKFAWVPYGGGAHMCIGLHFAYMQAKVFTYQLMMKFAFYQDENYEADFQVIPIPKPKDGMPVHIRPIEEAA